MTELRANNMPKGIFGINSERILGSGSCETSCTMLRKMFFSMANPLRLKIPSVVQRDMQIQLALDSSFGPFLELRLARRS